MFNGSSNIVIQGGTFLVIHGSLYQAESASQFIENYEHGNLNPNVYVSHGQVVLPGAERVSHRNPSWEENVQGFSEPFALGCQSSAWSSDTSSAHAYGQIPEHGGPYPVSTPSINSEVQPPWDKMASTPPTSFASTTSPKAIATSPQNGSLYPAGPFPTRSSSSAWPSRYPNKLRKQRRRHPTFPSI